MADGILSTSQMRQFYGSFYDMSPIVKLNRQLVPEDVWPLLPYAEFWGIADDWTREALVEGASPAIRENLKEAVDAFEDKLEEWLVHSESKDAEPSDEYVAFASLIMAADLV
jgi:hypothetical protein